MRAHPRCTYRVQLSAEFDFAAAAVVVPYLAELGISHLYCSPYMKAAKGSGHGYDVVDPARVSEELGGDDGLSHLDAALREHGMGQLLDIVPNHMCVSSPENVWWWDVLQKGRTSEFADHFDVEWNAPGLEDRVLVPVLGDPLDQVLERCELQVVQRGDALQLEYFEHRFPLRPDVSAAAGAASVDLLQQQHYVLEHWRTGLSRLNYRRFLDVWSLAGVRVEEDGVWDAVSARVLQLVRDGVVDGLRVDHVDGLHDPAAYLERLRGEAPEAWVVVEKVLAQDEDLPAWPVDGTSGYDFTALALALCVDPRGLPVLRDVFARFTGDTLPYEDQSRAARMQVIGELLHAELARLARVASAAGIGDAQRELAALLAGMPVYRIYSQGWQRLEAADALRLRYAAEDAARCEDCEPRKLQDLVAVLAAEGEDSAPRRELRVRFSQVSSALMAKGVEDTTFYRHVPLAALDEVGCDPRGVPTVTQMHDAAQRATAVRPRSLLATATHDTKRGEDVRARIAMLSEMPEAWERAVLEWSRIATRYRTGTAPSRIAEYLLYQTLVGAHPLEPERAAAYMLKAVREAKQETSWLDPVPAYEMALDAFVRGVTGDAEISGGIARLVAEMAPAWHVASLSQALLKLTSPGVPDIYQGCELWDRRLVDPDNRTPVDYALRHRLLRELNGMSARDVMRRSDEGLPKLHVLRTALRVRADMPAAFAQGSWYQPIEADGGRAAHAVAYMRGSEEATDAVLSVAVRLAHTLRGEWEDTTIDVPSGEWRNAFTGASLDGGRIALASLLQEFPVALLVRAG